MGKHILIVDDDRTQLTWMSEALLKKGYEVDTAASGVLAIPKLKTNKPDLIITNVLIPDMDGFQFYKEIRREKHIGHILVLTDRKLMADSFAALGAEHFLAKTCRPEELYAKIEAILALPPALIPPELPVDILQQKTPPPPPVQSSTAAPAPQPVIRSKAQPDEDDVNKQLIRGSLIGGAVIVGILAFIVVSAVRGFLSANKESSIASRMYESTPENFDEPVDAALNDEISNLLAE